MTRSYLDLSVAIGRPADVRALLRECRKLLGTPDDVPPLTSRTAHPSIPSGLGHIFHPAFWDFPAHLTIDYGVDGPMNEIPAEDASAEYRQHIAEDPARNGWAAIVVRLKPFVGWPEISPTGANDHDLGAWLIRELGRWLDRRRLPWQWEANGATTYLPYSSGSTNLAALGNASAGAVTPETIDLINKRYLSEWRRGWRGPHPWEGSLLHGWNVSPTSSQPPSSSSSGGPELVSRERPGTAGTHHGSLTNHPHLRRGR